MRKFTLVCLLATIAVAAFFSPSLTPVSGQGGRVAQAESKARVHLARKGLKAENLKVRSVEFDDLGATHVRFAQTIAGVRVYGAELITHEKANRRFIEETEDLFTGAVGATTPNLTEADAITASKYMFGSEGRAEAELVLYPVGDVARLAYLVDIANTEGETNDPRREQIVVDAITGEMIEKWDNLQTAATTGTGYGYYAGTVTSLPIDLASGNHTLFDVPNNGKTYDYNNRTCLFGCFSTGTIYSSTDNIFGATGALSDRQSIGVDAHFFAQKTLQYFFNTFGRRGIDNNNNLNLRFRFMVSRTHYGTNYNNAFWDGASMTYGDGDGTTYRPFDAVDVVGHEMMHGITERTSKLEYKNESGAANESFSDIFGTVIEFFVGARTGFGGQSYPADWWIGEDLFISSNPASPTRGIRNMSNTHAEGDPDHYSERYTGTADNGGVHINSGIMNYVFYLLVNGGTNHADTTGTTVTGIGMSDASKIAYDADTVYCTAKNTYAQVANAWMNAAKNRFGAGSAQAQRTFNAWKACGVTPTVTP